MIRKGVYTNVKSYDVCELLTTTILEKLNEFTEEIEFKENCKVQKLVLHDDYSIRLFKNLDTIKITNYKNNVEIHFIKFNGNFIIINLNKIKVTW